MVCNKIWEFFTYIFHEFNRLIKQHRMPESVKLYDDNDDIELNKMYDVSKYTFVIIRE